MTQDGVIALAADSQDKTIATCYAIQDRSVVVPPEDDGSCRVHVPERKSSPRELDPYTLTPTPTLQQQYLQYLHTPRYHKEVPVASQPRRHDLVFRRPKPSHGKRQLMPRVAILFGALQILCGLLIGLTAVLISVFKVDIIRDGQHLKASIGVGFLGLMGMSAGAAVLIARIKRSTGAAIAGMILSFIAAFSSLAFWFGFVIMVIGGDESDRWLIVGIIACAGEAIAGISSTVICWRGVN